MKVKRAIFLFGPPASGKDAQARLLAKKLKGKRITTSELLQSFFVQKKKRYLILPDKKKIDLRQEKEKYLS